MNIPDPAHLPPTSAHEYLARWSLSRGKTRRFFENIAAPPHDSTAQKDAGAAAAAHAAAELYDLDLAEYDSGLTTVVGALESAHRSTEGTQRPTPRDAQATPQVAAFFDIDNTLIQGSSLIAIVYGLARRKYFRPNEVLPIFWKQVKYRLSGHENATDMNTGRQQALEFVKGRSEKDVRDLCKEVFERSIAPRIWPQTQALADAHLAQGHEVWLVSATPVQLAQLIAEHLGFTGALGTVPEVKDGTFTGNLVGDILHGPGKKHAVAALATIENLDLSQCYAYSDSSNDLPMLSMVGTACAVNPDRQLARTAHNYGWEIYDFRSFRKAVRTYGLPTLLTAAFSLGGLRRWGRHRK
ncbi:MAG: HAD-IB family hydrolase [Corynebacterium sp.]|nr:HAD-IB family hydrolase [Corynebacterium sp.]